MFLASHVSGLNSLETSQGHPPNIARSSIEVQPADQPDPGTGRGWSGCSPTRPCTGIQVAVQGLESGSGWGHGCAGVGHLAHTVGAGGCARAPGAGAEARSRGFQPDKIPSDSAIGRGHDRQSCGVPLGRRSSRTCNTAPQDSDHPCRLRMPVTHRRQIETAETPPPAGGGSSIEVALVGLRLRNPDQQCYVNALALASLCWLENSLTVQAAAPHPFGPCGHCLRCVYT